MEHYRLIAWEVDVEPHSVYALQFSSVPCCHSASHESDQQLATTILNKNEVRNVITEFEEAIFIMISVIARISDTSYVIKMELRSFLILMFVSLTCYRSEAMPAMGPELSEF